MHTSAANFNIRMGLISEKSGMTKEASNEDDARISSRGLKMPADIAATAACLQALGARISYDGTLFRVLPLDAACPASGGVLPCGDSGSPLRFLLLLACALRAESSFALAGRLPERPMAPLYTALTAGGISINGQGSPLITCSGRLRAGHYQLPGDISSQFISGLLLALPLLRLACALHNGMATFADAEVSGAAPA